MPSLLESQARCSLGSLLPWVRADFEGKIYVVVVVILLLSDNRFCGRKFALFRAPHRQPHIFVPIPTTAQQVR